MNWKGIVRWTVMSMVFLLILIIIGSFLHGLLGGFDMNNDLDISPMLSGYFSISVFVSFYFADFVYGFGIVFSATVIWAYLSIRYPQIETSDRNVLYLIIYTLGYMVIFWGIVPIINLPVFIAGIFAFMSILLPRFISKKLVFGTFIKKQNNGQEFEERMNTV